MAATRIMIVGVAVLVSIGSTQSQSQWKGDDDMMICHANEHLTKLRLYVQDEIGGEKPTVWRVAECNITHILASAFGSVAVLDNLVTEGPEYGSKEVGRIQGLIALSDFHQKSLVMVLNLVFTWEEYKGSTLSFLGRNPLEEKLREIPVAGGTGAFSFARGYALTST